MTYQLTSPAGNIEAVIDDNCGMTKFLSIANILSKQCSVKFTAKEDNSETIDWFFIYKGRELKLHYNIYNGVSICSRSCKDNVAVSELSALLVNRFFQ